MNLGNLLFYFLLLVLTSCAALPELHPPEFPEEIETCNTPFVKGKWQFVHSIEATMPGGNKSFVIGISTISPITGTIESVIMTVEGVVVFEAKYHRSGISVKRGVAPFDSREFAAGLMNDIRLIFFKPESQISETGTLQSGEQVCRHKNSDHSVLDIILDRNGNWEIRQYDENYKLKRRVQARSTRQAVTNRSTFPEKLHLTVNGLIGYSLLMELINTESLEK